MQVVDIVRKKRDGIANSVAEINHLVSLAARGDLPDYQLSAWLMAVFVRGMDEPETTALTEALIHSGHVLDFSPLPALTVDKHSTGGVGDKTSLIVAPLVASAGLYVPMISGRALGHTGGTLDKLESIPGFRTDLTLQEFKKTVRTCGLALIGQTKEVVPADRVLYALRDVTATVESIPLIVASIVSEKVAEGTRGLVLDVKAGCGAFMKNQRDSERLARALVSTCLKLETRAVAVVSDMSQPLGRMVGNALEVRESIDTLRGEGPADLRHLCVELSAHMLRLGEVCHQLEDARRLARHQLDSGAALQKFRQVVAAQSGDPQVADDPFRLPESPAVFDYAARQKGYVHTARADMLGRAAMHLGAGREDMDSSINHAVGLELIRKVGDWVEAGETLVRVHYDDETRLRKAVNLLGEAYRMAAQKPERPPLIHKAIG